MSYSKSKLLLQPNQLQPKKPQPLLPNGPLCDHDNLCVLNTLTSGNIKTNTISANSIKVPGQNPREQIDLTEMLKGSLGNIEDIKMSIGSLNNRVITQKRDIQTQIQQLNQKLLEIEASSRSISNLEILLNNSTDELNRRISNINNLLVRHDQTISSFESSLSTINQRLGQKVDSDTFATQLSSTNSQLGILSSSFNQSYSLQQIVNSNYDQRLRNLESRR